MYQLDTCGFTTITCDGLQQTESLSTNEMSIITHTIEKLFKGICVDLNPNLMMMEFYNWDNVDKLLTKWIVSLWNNRLPSEIKKDSKYTVRRYKSNSECESETDFFLVPLSVEVSGDTCKLIFINSKILK